jgi:Ca2+-binding RTX toxin-like protein
MNLVRLLKIALTGGALLLTLALPTVAPAATVSVEKTQRDYEYEKEVNFANLRFSAEPGENNAVAIQIVTAEHGLHLILAVTDNGAPLTAGPGCSAGPAGSSVWCDVHPPRGPEYTPGFGKSQTPVPGTRWVDSMTIDLGDGNNSFDGKVLSGELDSSFAMTVTAGGGDDRILTGGGADLIDPGAGSDSVHTNDGPDRVLATADPDGPDVYDLGSDYYNPAKFGADEVDYSSRSAPVEWDGFTGVVAGEGDKLNGVENVFGGSGDDVLRGNEFENFLVGGPGNDVLVGGSNWDVLNGGAGNDELRGGQDPDILIGEAGDDTAYGGRGHDGVKCGAGWDQALRINRDRLDRCEVLRLASGAGLDSLLRS